MPDLQEQKGDDGVAIEAKRSSKLGLVSGVYIPVFLNILSILMFLRFGLILGQVGFIGILGLLVTAYSIDLLTTLSLSAIASNGEVKGGGAYYLISRSLGPEFGGSIGVLFFLAQAVNTAMNIVGLVDCIRLTVGPSFPQGYWTGYGLQTAALAICTSLCLLGSAIFSKASNALLVILSVAILSIPISAIFKAPFHDEIEGVTFTGLSFDTLRDNFLPYTQSSEYRGLETFRDLFGILFPATSGIFAGASMSGDLKNPSKAIPSGTLWAMLTTFCIYLTVIISMAASTTHESLLGNANVISITSLSAPVIFAGECAVTVFSALMGIIGSAKLFQALAKDKLLPGLSIFGRGTAKGDEPIYAILLTHAIAQVALLADLNQIATLISMGYQMTFFVMNLACFLLKIGSAPNFRPSFQFFSWQTALIGALLSAAAMFFIEETYAAMAICVLIAIFLLIHYLCPPKRWGDVSQNLIYHQVRKYLLRLKPEHIKFWRPQIILLVNNPRKQARLIQFCNSLKKGSLYILGHVIVTDDFSAGVHEARLQQQAWTNYISEFSRIKAFVQLTMSPSITWGIRNLILSAGLGGMRPNIAVMGFYNMEELRRSNPKLRVPDIPTSPAKMAKHQPVATKPSKKRRRGDTSARLLDGILPTDAIRTEGMMSPTDYMTMLEDLTLQYRLNVGVAYGFEHLETPRRDGTNTKKYVDLWPIQMSAEVTSEGKNLVTTNFDTYTLILQLGHILRSLTAWRNVYLLRVMVFVEYESEVEEERARVRALLEKLRIEAEVLVFWLASGDLNTYELIINGVSNSMDYEIVVNEGLKDEEWWDELQAFRGQSGPMSTSQELTQIATILDSTSGRPGVFNPHEDTGNDRRRTSIAEFADMRKRPDIAMLSKLGVSMGIHTHHLNDEVLEESAEEVTDSEAETSDEEEDFSWEVAEPFTEPDREPLLQEEIRKKGRRRKKNDPEAASGSSTVRSDMSAALTRPTYGTISATQNLPAERGAVPSPAPRIPQIAELGASPSPKHTNIGPYAPPPAPKEAFPSFDPPPLADIDTKPPRSGAVTPSRPGMSRQSSAVKFSSRPVPETTITGEDSRISFAPHTSTPTTPAVERPSHSRQSSWGKFSSRPSAEPRFNNGEGSSSKPTPLTERTVPAPRSAAHSRQHSRQNSQYSTLRLTTGDLSDSIPELNDAQKDQNDAESKTSETDNVDSTFSTQSVALSFNDLPSRAQHLILNELMKQNSNDTAVLLSTLPIPSEGTCSDENSTIQYLSDVEVLCNELPPTLMVLSNNMTVTVSL